MTTNRPRGFLVLLALLPALWLTSCSKSSTPGQTVSFISVSPTPIALFTGKTQQITVSAHYSDGSVKAVTSGATFTASAPAVASVSAAGMVTAVGVESGTGTVTAALGDKTADMVINVLSNSVPVFAENYAHGVSFLPFGGSNNALTVDTAEHHSGSASLRIAVPAAGYTGGALNAAAPQNLSLYNAVTFWAKASKAATLNVTGFGNDAMGGAGFAAESASIPLTTAWVKHIIPIPALEKLTANVGLFHFAEGSDEGAYTIWLDDIQYENLTSADLGSVTSASVNWAPFDVEIGKSQALTATGSVTYTLPSVVLSNVSLRYFALTSSAPAVATVTANGLVSGVSLGTANLTAQLGTLNIPGAGVVTVIAPIVPTTAPPRPTVAADKVISLLSKAYTNVGVDTWGTSWSNDGAGANMTPLTIGGDDVKKYTQLKYVGIEFTGSNMINASSMTYLHLDIWTPNITDFHVKLVDFGANGVYDQNGDDTAVEVAVNATTAPALTGLNQWVSLDIPMASFAAMNKQHLAQLLFVSTTPYGAGTVYVDNVYFHNSAYIDATPPTLAITDNVPGDTAVGDVTFSFTFSEDVGTSFDETKVTVTGGSKGLFTQVNPLLYTLVVAPPATSTGTINVSVAAGAFSDLANNASTTGASGSQAFDTNLPTAPVAAPPRPTAASANVISLLSEAYTNHTVDTWRTNWGEAAVLEEVMVGADHVKKYSSLDFVGITTEASMVDATAMAFVHLDVWTPDATVFKLKLVDFGANAAYAGGDDVEHELTFDSTTTPALVKGSWVSLDIPLTAFTNLTTRAHLAQYVLSAGGGTVFIDNFYFYGPTSAPTRPTLDASTVISLLSDAYTNHTVDTWRTSWGEATQLDEVMIGADHFKKYSVVDFVGISTESSMVDATSMNYFHLDVWVSNPMDTFKVKLVDFGANAAYGGGDDVEHELAFNASSIPALGKGTWVSLDLPLSSFTNLTTRAHLAQYVLSASPTLVGTVYVGNVYFHQ
ncbi:MAG: Ig-like domain-containing protein [Holophaga sp.]